MGGRGSYHRAGAKCTSSSQSREQRKAQLSPASRQPIDRSTRRRAVSRPLLSPLLLPSFCGESGFLRAGVSAIIYNSPGGLDRSASSRPVPATDCRSRPPGHFAYACVAGPISSDQALLRGERLLDEKTNTRHLVCEIHVRIQNIIRRVHRLHNVCVHKSNEGRRRKAQRKKWTTFSRHDRMRRTTPTVLVLLVLVSLAVLLLRAIVATCISACPQVVISASLHRHHRTFQQFRHRFPLHAPNDRQRRLLLVLQPPRHSDHRLLPL